ncbi:uncharacterized protein LOC120347469 isoform X1 [Styela clava]
MVDWEVLSCVFLSFFSICNGFLNIEELTNSKYALDIISGPMNELELPKQSAEGLKLASRHGQNYYCKLPFLAQSNEEKDEEKISKTTPLSSLLEPMKRESCLKTVVGWWTYEFCYGKYVKQYHSEGDTPKGDITFLGYYEADFDWNREIAEEATKFRRHRLNRYHSQSYVNGTSCDIIDHKRDTEIRYVCDDSSPETYIARVDEPSTCSYIITVHTPYICSHPNTKPLKNPKPVEIVCRPVLAPDDFAKFKEMEQAKKQNRKEIFKRAAARRLASEAYEFFNFEYPKLMKQHPFPYPGLKPVFKQLGKQAAEARAALLQQQKEEAFEQKDEKPVKGDGLEQLFYGQMKSLVDSLLPSTKNQKPTSDKKPMFPDFSKSKETNKANRKPFEAEAIKLIERFVVEDRLRSLDAFKQKLLVMNVADLLKKNQHLPTADVARKIEKYVSTFVGALEDAWQSQFDLDHIEKTMADSLTNQLMREVENMPVGLDSEKEKEEQSDTPKKKPSVHLKIHKINLDDLEKASETDEDIDPSWKKLEEDIGKSLEEAGFESEDNHIEIRVVTSHDKLGDVITLSTEEGEKFRDMLLELVAGESALNNEVKKQKTLHNNYNLVWKRGDNGFTSLSTFDEDNQEDTEGHVRSPKL